MAGGLSLDEAVRRSIDDLDGSFTYLVSTPEGFGVARDRFSTKPCLVAETDDWVAVVSEGIALAGAFGDEREIHTYELAGGEARAWTSRVGRLAGQPRMTATIDGHGKTTREINAELKDAIAAGQREIEVLNPGSRHSLAVGILEPARIVFRGDVGYFCGGLSDGLDIEVDGDAGWSLGADMMSGKIVVHGSSGSSTAPSIRGGLVVVEGNAGARSGDRGQGRDDRDRRLDRLHDRLHDAEGPARRLRRRRRGVRRLDVRGRALLRRRGRRTSAPTRCSRSQPTRSSRGSPTRSTPFGLGPKSEWKKVRSAGKLWRYDKKEFAVWKEAL